MKCHYVNIIGLCSICYIYASEIWKNLYSIVQWKMKYVRVFVCMCLTLKIKLNFVIHYFVTSYLEQVPPLLIPTPPFLSEIICKQNRSSVCVRQVQATECPVLNVITMFCFYMRSLIRFRTRNKRVIRHTHRSSIIQINIQRICYRTYI